MAGSKCVKVNVAVYTHFFFSDIYEDTVTTWYCMTVTTIIGSPDGQVLHSITHSITPHLPALHNKYFSISHSLAINQYPGIKI